MPCLWSVVSCCFILMFTSLIWHLLCGWDFLSVDHDTDAMFLVSIYDSTSEVASECWHSTTVASIDSLLKRRDLRQSEQGAQPVEDQPKQMGDGVGWQEESSALKFHANRDMSGYIEDVNKCLELINDGETYEVCLTNQLKCTPSPVDPKGLYQTLREVNPSPYAAWLSFGPVRHDPKLTVGSLSSLDSLVVCSCCCLTSMMFWIQNLRTRTHSNHPGIRLRIMIVRIWSHISIGLSKTSIVACVLYTASTPTISSPLSTASRSAFSFLFIGRLWFLDTLSLPKVGADMFPDCVLVTWAFPEPRSMWTSRGKANQRHLKARPWCVMPFPNPPVFICFWSNLQGFRSGFLSVTMCSRICEVLDVFIDARSTSVSPPIATVSCPCLMMDIAVSSTLCA